MVSHLVAVLTHSIGCAFKKGVCAMCGKAMMDTSMYTMSAK